MPRTTITLSDELALRLAGEARRTGRSKSEIARAALAAYFGLVATRPRSLGFVALGRSAHTDTAERFQEYLAQDWDTDRRR
jgi:predicted transcriptional regulator